MNPIYIISCKATRPYLKLVDSYLQSIFSERGFQIYLSANAIDDEKKWFKGILKMLDIAKDGPVVIIDTNIVDEELSTIDERTNLVTISFGRCLNGTTSRKQLFGSFYYIKEEIEKLLYGCEL